MRRYYSTPQGSVSTSEIVGSMRVIQLSNGMRGGKHRTNDSQIIQMGKLRLQGKTIREIAAIVGVHRTTVNIWMHRKLKLPAPPRRKRTLSCVCEECMTCRNRRYKQRWRAKIAQSVVFAPN